MSLRLHEAAQQWLSRANSNYLRAKQPKPDDVYWEDLCYDAQQATEKALKAYFVWSGKRVPNTQDIGELLDELETFCTEVPAEVLRARALSDYALATRYPGWGQPVTTEEYLQAMMVARQVLDWVAAEFDAVTTL